MTDFLYTLQRSAGGDPATLRVTEKAIVFTIPSSITADELEAVLGLQALAVALKREVHVTRPNAVLRAN